MPSLPYTWGVGDAPGAQNSGGPKYMGIQQDSKHVQGKYTMSTTKSDTDNPKKPCFLIKPNLDLNEERS